VVVGAFTQGSSFVATLGWMMESRWDSNPEFPKGITPKNCLPFCGIAKNLRAKSGVSDMFMP